MEEIERLMEMPDPFHLDPKDVKDIKFKIIKESYLHHFRNCKAYRNYCKSLDREPNDVKDYQDLVKIPLLPSNVFKERTILSVPKEEVTFYTSSGTSGVVSRVGKDRITLQRAFKSYRIVTDKLGRWRGAFVGIFSPDPKKLSTPLWFSTLMASALDLPKEFSFFVNEEWKIDVEKVYRELTETKTRPRHLVGPPFMYLYYIRQGQPVELDEDSIIGTGGGWKRFTGEMIEREEFEKLIAKHFGIQRENIRDGLNMVEINSVMLDCECKCKHIPPWLHVTVRDPKNPEEELPPGEEGLLGYLDPLAHSYPGFILSDDIGKIVVSENENCECGRAGPCLHTEIRRAKGTEARGCALKLEEFIELSES